MKEAQEPDVSFLEYGEVAPCCSPICHCVGCLFDDNFFSLASQVSLSPTKSICLGAVFDTEYDSIKRKIEKVKKIQGAPNDSKDDTSS
uniref:Uncharacterized protein n=1 Tax=Kalanchoe fedtschenkoi TaxID=63787 RepID=A0A7N0SVB3_KALFE